MSTDPKVSVLIVTYNQHAWIGQAIESALMQDVDFPFEIVIGDDFSTDGTRAIVEGYRDRHPDIIRLNQQSAHPAGVPGRVNQVTTLQACRGRFIAFLDGDDFWTDPGKLAGQVAALEGDPALSGVAHDALILYEGVAGDSRARFSELAFEDHAMRDRVGLCDLMTSPAFQTSTWMVRAEAVRTLPDWYAAIPAADWGLFAIAAEHGDTLVECEPRSVYRRHASSILAQLGRERAAERNRWHRQSFLAISRAFPHAVRTAAWKRVAARSRLNENVDRGRLVRAAIDFVVLFGVHDRSRIPKLLADPMALFVRVRSTLGRATGRLSRRGTQAPG